MLNTENPRDVMMSKQHSSLSDILIMVNEKTVFDGWTCDFCDFSQSVSQSVSRSVCLSILTLQEPMATCCTLCDVNSSEMPITVLLEFSVHQDRTNHKFDKLQ